MRRNRLVNCMAQTLGTHYCVVRVSIPQFRVLFVVGACSFLCFTFSCGTTRGDMRNFLATTRRVVSADCGGRAAQEHSFLATVSQYVPTFCPTTGSIIVISVLSVSYGKLLLCHALRHPHSRLVLAPVAPTWRTILQSQICRWAVFVPIFVARFRNAGVNSAMLVSNVRVTYSPYFAEIDGVSFTWSSCCRFLSTNYCDICLSIVGARRFRHTGCPN